MQQLRPDISEPEVVLPLRNLTSLWPQLFPVEQSRLAQLLIERVIIANGGLENGVAYAYSYGTGNATVNMSGGTLNNHSTSAMGHGLEAKADGSGNAAVNLTAGNVTTAAGYGIASWRGATGTGSASHTTDSSPPPSMTADPEAVSTGASPTATATLARARSRFSAVS